MKKQKKNTVAVVTELVQPIVDRLGMTLWDVAFEKEGSMWILRVVIDKAEGISLDDCEAVSLPLDQLLDEVDPIEQSYCLEVSSAGIERELKKDWHFTACMGQEVTVRLIRPYEGEREFVGILRGFENQTVSIETKQGDLAFAMADIAFVRLFVAV